MKRLIENEDETKQLLAQMKLNEKNENDHFFIEFEDIDESQMIFILNDQFIMHLVIKSNVFNAHSSQFDVFSFDRYSSGIFHGFMPDSDAADVFIAEQSQFDALKKLDSSIELNQSTVEQHQIRFDKDTAISIDIAIVETSLELITFHVLFTSILFLFCIQNMNKMRIMLDNLSNVLIQDKQLMLVIRK